MKRIQNRRKAQAGLFLLEALVSILIFSLGILGLVAMGSTAISAQSDAQYRTEAASYASEIASRISIGVDPLDVANSLKSYEHLPTVAGHCNFTGSPTGNAVVTDWIQRLSGSVAGVNGLPGATTTSESIRVETEADVPGSHNRVTVTVCWRPKDTGLLQEAWHQHVLISYVNL